MATSMADLSGIASLDDLAVDDTDDRSWARLPWSDPRARAGARRRLKVVRLAVATWLHSVGVKENPDSVSQAGSDLATCPGVSPFLRQKGIAAAWGRIAAHRV